jgi:hypothetical protein
LIKLKRKGFFLLALLLLPSLIYVFFALTKANFRKLPYHGPKAVRDTLIDGAVKKDTVYYIIPSFTLSDPQRNETDIKTFTGNTYIATIIRDWGPETAKQLKGLAEYTHLQQEDLIYMKFVFFVQSDSSLPAPLPQMADTLGLQKEKCITLHGTKEQVDRVEKLYYVGIEGAMHKLIKQSILVDSKGHVRGYYDISSAAGMKILKEDFEHLLLHDEARHTKEQFNIETKRK